MSNYSKQLIERCKKMGVDLYIQDTKLKYRTLKKDLPESLLKELKENKRDIINYLKQEENVDLRIENEKFPLSDIQSAYLLGRGDGYEYGNTSCHIYQEFLYPNLDTEKVERVWNALIEKHDMLRAIIYKDGFQKIQESVPHYKLMKESTESIRRKLENKVYEVEQWPMFDIGVSEKEKNSILHFSMDFMIADWSSIWKLLKEFENIYFDLNIEKGINFKPNISFRDYRKKEDEKKNSDNYKKSYQYWKEKITEIDGPPELYINTTYNREKPSFKRFSLCIEPNKWENLRKMTREYGLTPTAVVLAAYAVILQNWSYSKDFSLNLTIFDRKEVAESLDNLIGDFTSTSILSVKETDRSFYEFAKSINKQLFENLDNSIVSGVEVLRQISKLDDARNFILPYVFTSAIGLIKDRLIGVYQYGITQTPQVFIDCQVMDTNLGLQINWDVRENVFNLKMIKLMFKCFEEILNNLATNKDTWGNSVFNLLYDTNIDETYYIGKHCLDRQTTIEEILNSLKIYKNKAIIESQEKVLSYSSVYDIYLKIRNNLKLEKYSENKVIIFIVNSKIEAMISTLLSTLLNINSIIIFNITDKESEKTSINICNVDEKKDIQCVYGERIETCLVEKYIDEVHCNKLNSDKNHIILCLKENEILKSKKYINVEDLIEKNKNHSKVYEFSEDDQYLDFKSNSLYKTIINLIGIVRTGSTMTFLDDKSEMSGEKMHDVVKKHKINILELDNESAKMYINYLFKNGINSISDLRTIIIADENVDFNVMTQLKQFFPKAKIVNIFVEDRIDGIGYAYFNYEMFIKDSTIYPFDKNKVFILDRNQNLCLPYSFGILSALKENYPQDETLSNYIYNSNYCAYYDENNRIKLKGSIDEKVKIKRRTFNLQEVRRQLINEDGIGSVYLHLTKKKDASDLNAIVTLKEDYEYKNKNNKKMDLIHILDETSRKYKHVFNDDNYSKMCKKRDIIVMNKILNMLIKLNILQDQRGSFFVNHANYSNIDSKYVWMIDRWLFELENIGLIRKIDDTYIINEHLKMNNLEIEWEKLFDMWKDEYGNINLLKYIKINSDNILDIAKGNIDPVKLLYPDSSNRYTEALYRFNSSSKLINDYFINVLRWYMKNFSKDKIRILEIGAGTGSTTRKLLETLKGESYEYHFTDSLKYFFPDAKKRFGGKENVYIYKYDIDEDPIEQGLKENYFDLVIGAYVIENARNIKETLINLRKIISPKGFLVFSEPAENEPWILTSQAFMMEKPQNDDLRKDVFFMSADKWIYALDNIDHYSQTFRFPNTKLIKNNTGVYFFVKQFKKNKQEVNTDEIKKHLKGSLPSHMMPNNIIPIELEHFSNNQSNQDIQKIIKFFELRKPMEENLLVNIENRHINTVQAEIAKICSKVLHQKEIDIYSNFYDLGADSLLIARITTKIINHIDSSIPFEKLLREIIKNPTVYEISKQLELLKRPIIKNDERTNLNKKPLLKSERYKCANSSGIMRIIVSGVSDFGTNLDILASKLAEQSLGDIVLLEILDKEQFLEMTDKTMIEKLSYLYFDEIAKYNPNVVQIIGHSFGGMIALELAKRCLESGIDVVNLSMIESGIIPKNDYNDIYLEMIFMQSYGLHAEGINSQMNNINEKTTIGKIFKIENLTTLEGFNCKDILLLDFMKMKYQERFKLYSDIVYLTTGKSIEKEFLMFSYRIFKHTFEAQKYVPDIYYGDIDYYITKNNLGEYKHLDLLLKNLKNIILGTINIFYIDGNHFSIIKDEECINKLSLALQSNFKKCL